MAHGPRYRVPFRRRREGKTDFHQRFTLVRSGWNRLVVRKSLKHMTVQIIKGQREGDFTLASSHSSELKKYGWDASTCNIPAAYLTGYICGLKAKKAGIEKAVLDLGLQRIVKGSRIFAALAGAVDAGLDVPLSEDVLPPDERKRGAHVGVEKTFDTVLKNIQEALQ
jgi:large subunit ribosomal protein L18